MDYHLEAVEQAPARQGQRRRGADGGVEPALERVPPHDALQRGAVAEVGRAGDPSLHNLRASVSEKC